MDSLYLSGGITNVKNYKLLFQEAESLLLQAGYEIVVNPAKIEPQCKHEIHDWGCNMRYDLMTMLEYCDGIALLPNWFASRGANVELSLAQNLGFGIGTVEQWIERAK